MNRICRTPGLRWHARGMRRFGRRGGRRWITLVVLATTAPIFAANAPIASASEASSVDALQSSIVSLDPAAAPLTRMLLMAVGTAAASSVVEFSHGSGYAAPLSSAVIETLRATRGVLAVTPNRVLYPQAAPQLEQTNAPTAWAAGWRGDGQTIVIIDTGVDATNPNLVGKVVDEACFTPAHGAGGDCPNGTTSQTGAGAAVPCTGRPDCSHGTHVASTAAANGPVVYGLAPNASVAAIRVFSSVTDPSDSVMTDEASLVRALEWVDEARATQPIASVNLSLGGGPVETPCGASPALTSLIDRLTAAGIAIVASAGNDTSTTMVSFPACVPSVLSVGAEARAGRAASFTNVAPTLDFFAPGEAIDGAWSSPCCTRTLSGTSFAAPQVAAAFALLRQELGAGAVAPRAELLRRTGDPVYVPVAGTWSATTALRVGRALDPQFQSASPVALARGTSPFGSFDALRVDPSGFHVSGWALDSDTAAPVTVHVYVDGVFAATTVASRNRSDVGSAFAGYGNAHGYEADLVVPLGAHTVCTYGLDLGGGSGNVLLACRRAAFGAAIGALDGAVGAAGVITVSGWAIDTARSAPVAVELTVDDVVVARASAAGLRPDVGMAYPGYGPGHGFSLAASAAAGPHRVCVRAAGSTPGAVSESVGCREVDVPSGEPFGVVDAVLARPRSIVAQGWAIDPDTTRPIDIAVLLDGVAVVTAGADQIRPDLVSGVPGYGASHGFAVTVAASPGRHLVCVDGVDVVSGLHASLGCSDIDVP
jgi:hypothetical protein